MPFAFCDGNTQTRNYKILTEIKDMYLFSIKQNNEQENEAQIKLAFKEYENFMNSFKKFEFFFDFKEKLKDDKEELNKNLEKYKNYVSLPYFEKYIEEYRYRECEDIFSKIDFNMQLMNYAIDKVLEEERIEGKYLKNEYDVNNYWIVEFLKAKFVYYFKDTKNFYLFFVGIFILAFVIMLSILSKFTRTKGPIPGKF